MPFFEAHENLQQYFLVTQGHIALESQISWQFPPHPGAGQPKRKACRALSGVPSISCPAPIVLYDKFCLAWEGHGTTVFTAKFSTLCSDCGL